VVGPMAPPEAIFEDLMDGRSAQVVAPYAAACVTRSLGNYADPSGNIDRAVAV